MVGSSEEDVRERVLEVGLYSAFDRSSTVLDIEALVDELSDDLGCDDELVSLRFHALAEVLNLDTYDGRDGLFGERIEGDDVVDTVDELGRELLLQRLDEELVGAVGIHLVVGKTDTGAELLQLACADVTRKHDDGVAEIDAVSLTVGEPSFVQDLEEDVEDVGVRFLYLVKEDDGVGFAAHGLGELTAVFVGDVSRRRSDEERDRMFLHILGHVEAYHRVLGAEHLFGKALGEVGLTDAGLAEEEEGTDRAFGVAESESAALDSAYDGLDGQVLSDDLMLERVRHGAESFVLGSRYALYRHAGHHTDDTCHVFDGDGIGCVGVCVLLAPRMGPCAYFVKDVDGFVGERAVVEVALGEADASAQDVFGVEDVVVGSVVVGELAEYVDGLVGGRRPHRHFLETSLEGPVFLDGLGVLGGGGSPDALYLSAREGGLEDVGCIERAGCVTGTDEGVYLVHKEDDVLVLLQLGDDLFHTLLELSAVGSAGDHRGDVEGDDPFAFEGPGLVGLDTECESFDDGRLTHTGFADEDGVVLLSPAENLDDALYLHLASYDRVELSLLGLTGEVMTVLIERAGLAVLAFGVIGGLPVLVADITHLLVAVHRQLGRVMRLAVEVDEFVEGQSPLVLQVGGGGVDLFAHDSHEEVGGAYRLCSVLAADSGRDAQDPLDLRALLHGVLKFFGPAYGILEGRFGFLGLELRTQEQVVGGALDETEDSEQHVLGLDLSTLQTFRFVLRVYQNLV